MKVTIEIPDTTVVMTYQYVFDNEKLANLQIQQKVLDSKALAEMKEANRDAEDT